MKRKVAVWEGRLSCGREGCRVGRKVKVSRRMGKRVVVWEGRLPCGKEGCRVKGRLPCGKEGRRGGKKVVVRASGGGESIIGIQMEGVVKASIIIRIIPPRSRKLIECEREGRSWVYLTP